MKFAAIVSAAALAAVTNAVVCDMTSLQKLLALPDTTKCASESKYAMTSLKTPTNDQLKIMCSNTACKSVMSKIKTLAPTECTLSTFSLYADLINPLTAHCDSVDSVAGSPATPNVIVGSNNTTSNVTESGSKTPQTSKDNTYTFTPGTTDDTNANQNTPTPDAMDDTNTDTNADQSTRTTDATDGTDANQNTLTPDATDGTDANQNTLTPDATVDTSLVQTTTSSGALDEASAGQTTTPDSNTLDETNIATTSGAISVNMACVSAGAFVVAVATTIF